MSTVEQFVGQKPKITDLITGSGNFTPLPATTLLIVTMIGPGGTGGGSSGSMGGGGGAGEFIYRYAYKCVGGTPIAYVVGAPGSAVSNGTGNVGTDTTFGTLTAKAGKPGVAPTTGGQGGGRLGPAGGGANVAGLAPVPEGLITESGASGGGSQAAGGPCEVFTGGTSAANLGGGGAASPYGNGANGNNSANGLTPTATSYGAAGGGTGLTGGPWSGGLGINGRILIEEYGN